MDALWDAWSAWGSGHLRPDHELWGLSVFWWGRVGKIVALLSAFAIVAEFAGPARLRRIGGFLHGTIDIRQAAGRVYSTYLWGFWTVVALLLTGTFFWLRAARPRRQRIAAKAVERKRQAGLVRRWWMLWMGGITAVLIWASIDIAASFCIFDCPATVTLGDWPGVLLFALVIFVFLMLFAGWVAILALPALWILALAAVNVLAIEPFAWLMEKGDKGVKASSLALLLLGFHFDMLAS